MSDPMEDKSLEKLCTVGELQMAFTSLQQENAALQSQITALEAEVKRLKSNERN